MMEWAKKVFNYLVHLEWTERIQHNCTFCDRANFAIIVYEDDEIIAVENRHLAGQQHWLILPKQHTVRDIENLNGQHLALLQAMDRVKKLLLAERAAGISPSAVQSGYHRGRRRLVGSIFWPDIISIHHLHLHVIVQPHLWLRMFKYPRWFPLMWKSDMTVLREVQGTLHALPPATASG
ncbi:Histidine triad-like motif-containing protein [Cordyceps militaris CM01]|uniref:Histidine triad-like motif-containing protein n=2 Tax=Cordyceps militaris TaxID=73501 RepID=G3J6V1_CORMM|nr:Histidine triad-like motif-containing protein [Cordyceps militaris CM01]ATY62232.1 Histidine triad-like motif-containing [Cordyceps militaris]EGX96228.1 Histidine triad-like motif-containing protein [Cordyceps militaris CM01]